MRFVTLNVNIHLPSMADEGALLGWEIKKPTADKALGVLAQTAC